MSRFRARFFHDWGSSTWLWADNDETREVYDYDIDHHVLDIGDVAETLDRLATWHDEAMDWEDPRSPSPWGRAERDRFNAAVAAALAGVRRALGDDWEVVDEVYTYERGG